MARKAREKSSTGIYAVMLRGNTDIFAQTEMRDEFIAAANTYLDKGLMGIRFADNSVDMLISETKKGISMDMKPLITSFARTYNRTHKIDGKVFADRFKSVPVESDELRAVCLEYLGGGEKAAPYLSGRKTSVPRAAKKTAAPAEIPIPPEQIAPKPKKKKSSLPSWLL